MAEEKKKPEDVMATLAQWEFLQRLPLEIAGFQLQKEASISDEVLQFAGYVHEKKHSQLRFLYSAETGDYILEKHIGLNIFRDVRFIFRNRERFAEKVSASLPRLIAETGRELTDKLGYESLALHFEEWDYWRSLPQQISNFQLFLTPDKALRYINGSTVFLDYADFSGGNQLRLMYNSFRDEIFAEYKRKFLPLTKLRQYDLNTIYHTDGSISDAPMKNLQVLSLRLEERLEKALAELARD